MTTFIGSRSLIVTLYKDINEKEYQIWKDEFDEAANAIDDREEKIEKAAAKLEQDLILLGRVAKNLRNANLNLASKIDIFWGFNLKKPHITDLENLKGWNLNLKKIDLILASNFEVFWGLPSNQNFWGSSKTPWILSYFWAIFKVFFTNFLEVFRGSSKNLKNLDLILTSSFEVYWG